MSNHSYDDNGYHQAHQQLTAHYAPTSTSTSNASSGIGISAFTSTSTNLPFPSQSQSLSSIDHDHDHNHNHNSTLSDSHSSTDNLRNCSEAAMSASVSVAGISTGTGTGTGGSEQLILVVQEHDVLSGRGVNIAQHPGNERFRTLVTSNTDDAYCTTFSVTEKKALALEIIQHIKSLDPPGRFLKREGKGAVSRGLGGPWEELSEKESIKKTCQALRDCNRHDRSGYAEGVRAPSDVKHVVERASQAGLTVKDRAVAAVSSYKPCHYGHGHGHGREKIDSRCTSSQSQASECANGPEEVGVSFGGEGGGGGGGGEASSNFGSKRPGNMQHGQSSAKRSRDEVDNDYYASIYSTLSMSSHTTLSHPAPGTLNDPKSIDVATIASADRMNSPIQSGSGSAPLPTTLTQSNTKNDSVASISMNRPPGYSTSTSISQSNSANMNINNNNTGQHVHGVSALNTGQGSYAQVNQNQNPYNYNSNSTYNNGQGQDQYTNHYPQYPNQNQHQHQHLHIHSTMNNYGGYQNSMNPYGYNQQFSAEQYQAYYNNPRGYPMNPNAAASSYQNNMHSSSNSNPIPNPNPYYPTNSGYNYNYPNSYRDFRPVDDQWPLKKQRTDDTDPSLTSTGVGSSTGASATSPSAIEGNLEICAPLPTPTPIVRENNTISDSVNDFLQEGDDSWTRGPFEPTSDISGMGIGIAPSNSLGIDGGFVDPIEDGLFHFDKM